MRKHAQDRSQGGEKGSKIEVGAVVQGIKWIGESLTTTQFLELLLKLLSMRTIELCAKVVCLKNA